MNGFRVTILTLLSLSLVFMFYAVFFVVPDWQSNYNVYQASLRMSTYDQKSDIHRQKMVTYDPDSETPEVEKARLAAEEAAKQHEKAVMEAEEIAILTAAKRREEAERLRAEQEAAAHEAAASVTSLGVVASYDSTWQSVMIRPAENCSGVYERGATLAIFRGGSFLVEIVVDSVDIESGQISATLSVPQGMPGVNADGTIAPELQPRSGDIVSRSPFLSTDELRAESGQGVGAPVLSTPLPSLPAAEEPAPLQSEDLPSIDEDDALPGTAQPLPAAPSLPVQPPADVQRALDAIPSSAPSSPAGVNSLPSLDSMLQPTLF